MNSNEAKKLNLPQIMSRLGYEPVSVKKGGNEYWYNSPFRSEKDASFHTSFLGGKWIWNDFGDDGGTVIDFVMRHENLYSVSDALGFLDNLQNKIGAKINNQPSFSFQQQGLKRSEFSESKELKFLSAKPIEHQVIFSYLTKERGIDRNLTLKHLQEIKYQNLNNVLGLNSSLHNGLTMPETSSLLGLGITMRWGTKRYHH